MSQRIKVYVVGDCHTARIQGQHINAHLGPIDQLTANNPSIEKRNSKILVDSNIEVNFWGVAGFKCFGIDLQENVMQNTPSSPAEDTFDLPGLTDNIQLKFDFANILEADLIMPWMGYVDCRNWIPKYKNAELIVRDYVDAFHNVFPGKKLRFIEPFPQFQELHTYNYPSLSYDVKLEADQQFRDALSKISADRNLLPPIGQNVVYDAVGENTLHSGHARKGNKEYHNETTIDALRYEYNQKVYLNISEEIKKTVDLLF
jgi:hypothetical protein